MAAIFYLNETTDPKLHALPKYAVGDRMRIVKYNGDILDYEPNVARTLGRVLTIKEIILWEHGDPDNPAYHVTYTFYIAHLTGRSVSNRHSYEETVYLDDDEIEPVKKRGK